MKLVTCMGATSGRSLIRIVPWLVSITTVYVCVGSKVAMLGLASLVRQPELDRSTLASSMILSMCVKVPSSRDGVESCCFDSMGGRGRGGRLRRAGDLGRADPHAVEGTIDEHQRHEQEHDPDRASDRLVGHSHLDRQ